MKPPTKPQLNRLCRDLVVVLRDRNECQRCGVKWPGSQIQWCHVKAGRAKSLYLKPWASLALCAGCHFHFDARGNGRPGSESRLWWAAKFPDRELKLQAWEHDRKHPKFDPMLEKLSLERDIRTLGGTP